MAEPVWNIERDDIVYPSAPEDVLRHHSTAELRGLLNQRLQHALDHPEDLMTIEECHESLVAHLR
jgi:hypothetical protein